jgi:broad specificity phosphatase PhoE
MALTVTLVRHGQTERSSRGAYSGQLDVPLTSLGREQALRCAEQLAGAGGVDSIYTSPLARALDTAQAIADATGVPLTVDDRLIEVDYGPFEGLDREGARATFGQAFDDWRADPFGSPVDGMETLPAALKRASAASEHPVLVGHQGILRIVLISLGELARDDYFSQRLKEAEPIVITEPAIVDR